jgi:iron complex outermembrane receptor protein
LYAQTPSPTPVDLGQASLEDLMNIEVTSVSKREEKLSRAAAAVFVINADDIRRSGATNIPDLLRMVPGVDVEQISANAWAISIRGFNSRYSNKVLVLIDGRTVYDPFFSGTYWDQIELPLEDIDRIEVIKGPGSTVWGANAVNGVISIMTKSSKDTKGGLLTAGAGSQTKAAGELQYGGNAGPDGTYRVFGSYFGVGDSASQSGGAANDNWQRSHAGFRSDWEIGKSDALMVQGDLFANQENETVGSLIPNPYDPHLNQSADAAGGDVLALWNHTLTGGSQTSLQFYYNTYRRTDVESPSKVTTFDLDFHHHISLGDRNDVVWGLGYRSDTMGVPPGYTIVFTPPFETKALFNVFVQDEIQISDSLWFTIGGKLEHNGYTGFETEPSARIVWAPPGGRQSVWAAASKAIRQPSPADNSIDVILESIPLNASSVEQVRLFGNPLVRDEQVRDYELGYRSELTKSVSLDIATFVSLYRDLDSFSPESAIVMLGSPVTVEVPTLYGNEARATDYGGEVYLTWKAVSRWRVSPGYAYLHASVWLNPSPQGTTASSTVSTDFPQNTVQVRSLFNLSRKTEFDQSLYYTARLPGGVIPGHTRLDLRLGRKFGESTEISLVGQNLLRPRTLEYGDSAGIVGTESVRSVYGKISWQF